MACAVAVPPPPAAMETPAVPVIRLLPGVPSSTNARTTPAPMSRPTARCLPKIFTNTLLSLDLGPVRADDGHERPPGGPGGPGQRPEVPGRLIEARGAPGPGEVELLRGHGAGDLRLANTSIDVEPGRQTGVRRKELAEDVAGAPSPEQNVAGGEHGDEVIRRIGIAAEVGPEAAPRLVDGRRRQQAGVDLEPWRDARVVGEDDYLALVVHVVVRRCIHR